MEKSHSSENKLSDTYFLAGEVLNGSTVSHLTGYLTNVIMFGPGQLSPIYTKDY